MTVLLTVAADITAQTALEPHSRPKLAALLSSTFFFSNRLSPNRLPMIQAMIRKKEKARRAISTNREYQRGDLTQVKIEHLHMHIHMQRWFNPSPPSYSQDDLERCLYSIGDNDSFLNSNRLPIDTCIALLQQYFHPDSSEDGYSLAIDEGADGCRLTHSHKLQFNYVLQSLTLWRNIIDDLFRLWYGSPDRRMQYDDGDGVAHGLSLYLLHAC
jgi:hypothetical protein